MASINVTVKFKKRWFFMPVMMLINLHLAFMNTTPFCPRWLVNIGIKKEIVKNG